MVFLFPWQFWLVIGYWSIFFTQPFVIRKGNFFFQEWERSIDGQYWILLTIFSAVLSGSEVKGKKVLTDLGNCFKLCLLFCLYWFFILPLGTCFFRPLNWIFFALLLYTSLYHEIWIRTEIWSQENTREWAFQIFNWDLQRFRLSEILNYVEGNGQIYENVDWGFINLQKSDESFELFLFLAWSFQ